jgi:DNA-3-methyladenine glycosylase
VTVARSLVGCRLIRDPGTDREVVCRLVEVEAYLGTADPASHAHRGPTPRAAIMFGPPGLLYVYFSYGMHHCANVVTEPSGAAGAVLLRAATVESGEAAVRARRGAEVPTARLLSGPGNLCRGLAIDLRDNGTDIVTSDRLELRAAGRAPEVASGTRVGISKAADLRLRFWWAGHPALSAPGQGSRTAGDRAGS